MSRLFISHSSKDNVTAKAFKQWLGTSGWSDDDVFLDLDDIGAGERWKEALRKANARCEVVVLLASHDALSSPECLAEVRKAEDYGKEIIVVLLRDIEITDRRLDSYKDRQIVNLEAQPQRHVETVDYRDQQHEVRFNAEAMAKIKEYLFRRGITPDHFAWPPPDRPDAEPYPGLSAFGEDDAGIFFGRDADILRGLDKVRLMRRNGRPAGLLITAASGAGKSSYLRAGLWPRLKRDSDFAPLGILRPGKGILTGLDGLGRRLAARLSRPDKPINPGDIHVKLMAHDLVKAAADFGELISAVADQAHEQRRASDDKAPHPALLLGIDQAEELFAAEDAAENRRFAFLFSKIIHDPPPGIDLFILATIRSDGVARLLRAVNKMKLEFPETLPLLPLPRTSYRDVILEPLKLLARRGKKLVITAPLAERLVGDAMGADALPLLAFTLSHLYQEFGSSDTITVDRYEAIGGISGSIELALKRALAKPGDDPSIPAAKGEQNALMRAAFIPWLARIDPQTGQPMRRVARLDQIPEASRALVKRLIEARLLVADNRANANVVEIAHESLLRRWLELIEWLRADAEDLKAVEGIAEAAGEWAHNERKSDWLNHRGTRLRAAERIKARTDFRKLMGVEGLAYIDACRVRERERKLAFSVLAACFATILAVGTAAWRYQQDIREEIYWFRQVRPYLHSLARERTLQAHDSFKECSDCPTMIVVQPGNFMMGSPKGQGDRSGREYPAHPVTIESAFAVAEVETTFAEWDACSSHGDCDPEIAAEWGREQLPVINVTYGDAMRYAAWLTRLTGKPYRLLSEAEYEYAARAGMQTAYPWGPSVGNGNADCGECGSRWDAKQTAPSGSFPPNRFGLKDMVGNVFEWVEDCFHDNYDRAPIKAVPWSSDKCPRHVVRGGGWLSRAALIRSAYRDWQPVGERKDYVGFRVARTLAH